jgi:tetratricopeptide (TPR) repeat protein
MSNGTTAKDIFADALELPPDQRDAFIRRAATGNPALLVEVRALLDVHQSAGCFLDTPTMQVLLPRSPGRPVEGPGSVIGRYRLLEPLGQGGFGTVFLAEQREPVVRRVALKIIKLGMDTDQVIARFEAERQALAVMDHPNIAKVLDAGATDTGRPYFVMELVKGEPITDFCDHRSLTIPQRLDLFGQVCQAVQHAHTKGVIHRDLKPSNILVSDHDGTSLARVIDFGIAKATGRHLTDKTVFTESHQLIGTPEYMSPEQADGGVDIDTRTDVYSLGVLLYELLAGSTPFDPRRLRSAAYGELLRIIRETDPPRPSTRLSESRDALPAVAARRRIEPARLAPALRGDLDWIVMKALDKDRARRYDSPSALAADLQRHRAGEPVSAAPPGAAYRLKKFVRRHRAGVIAGALVSGALVLGIAGTATALVFESLARAEADRQTGLARDNATAAAEQARRADEQATLARHNARVADSVNSLLTDTIQKANRSRQQGRADMTVREVMDMAAADLVAGRRTHEPEVELGLAETIGLVYHDLSLYEPAERVLRIAVERAQEVHGPASTEYASALGQLGAVLMLRGQQTAAGQCFEQARAVYIGAGDEGAAGLAALRADIAELAADQGDLDRAESEVKLAIAYFEGSGKTSVEPYAGALHNLANIRYLRGDAAGALPLLQHAAEIERALYGDEDVRTYKTRHGLIIVQSALGDPGAEQALRDELIVARKLFGDEGDETWGVLHSLGVLLARKGDLEGAEKVCRESWEIATRIYGPDNRETAGEASALATTLIDLSRYDEAEPLLAGAVPVLSRPPGDNGSAGAANSDAMFATYQYGLVLQRRGALARAEPVLRPAVEASRAIKEGDRYEWGHWALASLLGGVLTGQAADESLGRDERLARLRQAEELVPTAAERLLTLAPRIGPRTRTRMIPPALDRAVTLYTALNQLDPTPEHTAALADWQSRRAAYQAAPSPKPAP